MVSECVSAAYDLYIYGLIVGAFIGAAIGVLLGLAA